MRSACTWSLLLALMLALFSWRAAAEEWCVSGGAIPETAALTRSFTIPASQSAQTVVSVRVRIVASHPWVGDLHCLLRSPSGTEVVLLDQPGTPSAGYPGPWGCGGDGIDAWFDDGASVAAEGTCVYGQTPVLAGSLRPLQALAALAGGSPVGTWSLVVRDVMSGDCGTLTTACVQVVVAEDCNRNGRADELDIALGMSSDANLDGVPDECACAADLDGDGLVTAADLSSLLSLWGDCASCAADLSGDSTVSAADLAIMLSQWGACFGQGAS